MIPPIALNRTRFHETSIEVLLLQKGYRGTLPSDSLICVLQMACLQTAGGSRGARGRGRRPSPLPSREQSERRVARLSIRVAHQEPGLTEWSHQWNDWEGGRVERRPDGPSRHFWQYCSSTEWFVVTLRYRPCCAAAVKPEQSASRQNVRRAVHVTGPRWTQPINLPLI